MERTGGIFTIAGIPLRASPFPLERQVPTKMHKKRRNQSESYHRRVQKKWLKRWGTKTERYAILMNNNAVGFMGGKSLFLAPRDMAVLRGL